MTATTGPSPFEPLFRERVPLFAPPALKEKENQFRAFEMLGIPSRKDEQWKYTSLAALKTQQFKNPTQGKVDSAKAIEALGLPPHQTLLLESGKLSWSGLNYDWGRGVQVLSRQEVSHSPLFPPLAKTEGQFSKGRHGMDALAEAMSIDGVVIHIHHDTQVKAPIYIVHLAGEPHTLTSSKSLIAIEANAEVTICEIFISQDGSGSGDSTGSGAAASMKQENPLHLHQTRLNIVCSNNAKLHYYRLQNENSTAYHLTNTEVLLQRDARFESTELSLGSQVGRHDLKVRCLEPGASVRMSGGWIADQKQVLDHHTEIEHVSGNTESQQFYKGILADHSRGIFNGRIFIHSKAQLSKSELLNKNLLLHSTAEMDTKPELEILANDVKASHGATVGQIDPQQLFYLESRGVPKTEATQMLVSGYLEEVLNHGGRPLPEPYTRIVRQEIAEKMKMIAERRHP